MRAGRPLQRSRSGSAPAATLEEAFKQVAELEGPQLAPKPFAWSEQLDETPSTPQSMHEDDELTDDDDKDADEDGLASVQVYLRVRSRP